ncbi:alpha/beta fold hydrolase [Poseidonibacter lekithochrous]|uniref:alpha/beta fold hydrolase n=1 Tax=Poseidonibacter lekithochrous TaxID=1904463 RepID=UPI0008FC6981|nr:alpha/beta hydrolase [Poseidonibacter lekithochrous]QKJ23525.1 alpha/beta hydrolase family protein [Poseidonibacter lekithochrous]
MKEKIYLIPGLMTDERLWSRVIPLLEDDYELVHVPIPHTQDFDEIIDILFNLFPEEKVNLLGFSLGGYIASYFAVTYPNRVNKLFMLAATPGASNEAEIERRKEKFAVIEKDGFNGLTYEKAKSLVEKKDDEELIKIVQDMFIDLGKETFISQLTSTFNRIDLFEDLVNLDLPIYFYYSTNDRLLNKEALVKLLSTKHNMKVVSREGTSHNVSLEVPEELSKQVRKWIEA